jgi:Cu(I)/Ag(I) efflux system protein CusF
MAALALLAALALALMPGAALAQHVHGGPTVTPAFAPFTATTDGVVVALDPGAARLVVEHGPIAAAGWGPMTMAFQAADPGLLEGISPGDKVRMDIRFDSPQSYLVVDLERIE